MIVDGVGHLSLSTPVVRRAFLRGGTGETLLTQRSDLNAARSSAAKSSGSSHAAK
jgi:hypothetical protein